MDKAINKTLYIKVLEDAKNKFERFPSDYASMWIQRQYQKLGGKYYGKKSGTNPLSNWRTEKWIQILPLLQHGKIIVCGEPDGKSQKACRPIVRINKDTSITIQELLELYSVEDIIKLAEKKNNDMKGRANWKDLKFKSSK